MQIKSSKHICLLTILFEIKEKQQISNNCDNKIFVFFHWVYCEAYPDISSMECYRYKRQWISSKETSSASQSALWLQVPSSQSNNLFFSTKAQAISYATFKQHCTYLEDLNLDLEVMRNQIRVKQEYSKKYTTSENWEARYLNAKVYKNYERLMVRFLCHREQW